MPMSYSSLIAAKGSSGAIATTVNYSLLDIPPILDEAQTLLYSVLRCREMQTDFTFGMNIGGVFAPLPPRFLDPIGRAKFTTVNVTCMHKDANYIERLRSYNNSTGTLGNDPFTTTALSNLVAVALTAHGFNQDSVFNTTGATLFNGTTIVGTFPVVSITDANNFVIDISNLAQTPSGSGAGGGSAVAYICDNLVAGFPRYFGIWNERINFDSAFTSVTLGRLQYYQSLPLLSATNQTNFLTNRYPQLMRVACMAAAADFMKDSEEYQKHLAQLQAYVLRISVENDMVYRGMELDAEVP